MKKLLMTIHLLRSWKKFIRNLRGQGINDYKTIKIDKDSLKRIFLKLDITMEGNYITNIYTMI